MISLINKMNTSSYKLSENASNTSESVHPLKEETPLNKVVERCEEDENVVGLSTAGAKGKSCDESDNIFSEAKVTGDTILGHERKNSNNDSILDIDAIDVVDNGVLNEQSVDNISFSNKHSSVGNLGYVEKPGHNFNVLTMPSDIGLNKKNMIDIKSKVLPKFEESYHNLAIQQLETSTIREVDTRRKSKEMLSPAPFLQRCKYDTQLSSPGNLNIGRMNTGVVSCSKVPRKSSSSVVEIDQATDSVSILEHLARSFHDDPYYESQIQSRILNALPSVSTSDDPIASAISGNSVHARSSSEPCEELCVENLRKSSGLKRNVSLPLGVDSNLCEDGTKKKKRKRKRRNKKRRKKSKVSDVEALQGRHNIAAQERRKMVVVVSVFAAAIFLTAVLLIIITLHMSQNINAKGRDSSIKSNFKLFVLLNLQVPQEVLSPATTKTLTHRILRPKYF